MGKTVTEKILAKAAGRVEVSAGEYIQIAIRRPVVLGWILDRGPDPFDAIHATKVYDPTKLRIINGHYGVTASHRMAAVTERIREWSQRVGVPPENIYNLGRQGVEHVLSGEMCWPLPGEVFAEFINGHTSALGALGSFAFTLSFESGAFLVTGKTWVQVPETAKIVLTGRLRKGVTPRDIAEYVLAQLGGAGAAGQVMEWTGPVVDDMGMDGRFTLCAGALFTGAWTAVVNPDRTTIDYVKAHTNESFEPLTSDPDASFAAVHEFDVSRIEPQVVVPPKRDTVKPLSELKGMKITRGFIGSCFNSRLEDMRLAARILKGRKIHPEVVLNITPGTMGILRQCLREGIMETFAEADVVSPPPACGMCVGANTPLAAGDVCLSTSTCNYPGRMGSRKADIYLTSPAVVAASCIEGRLADPRDYL